jgi:hypothetical protein
MPVNYHDPEHIKPLRRAYTVARCQATYRGELWDLTWNQWLKLWLEDDNYRFKGRGARDLTLSRKDYRKSWTRSNVQIEQRRDHLSRIVNEKLADKALRCL